MTKITCHQLLKFAKVRLCLQMTHFSSMLGTLNRQVLFAMANQFSNYLFVKANFDLFSLLHLKGVQTINLYKY